MVIISKVLYHIEVKNKILKGDRMMEAKKYVEGRPIDLIEKAKLVSVLKKIETI